MSKDNESVRKFVYWPNFELSEDGRNIDVGTGAGLDVKVTISNSLVQCVGQPLNEKCRWFKMSIKYLATGSFLMLGLNPGCLTGMPEWNRFKSVRYVSDTGGVLSNGVGDNTNIKYGVGDEVVCFVEKFFEEKCLVNFFTNGRLVYRHWGLMTKDNIYATIGVKNGPANFTVDWPQPDEYHFDQYCIENWIFPSPSIQVNSETNCMELTQCHGNKQCYSAQSSRPLGKGSSYFEIKIKEKKSVCPAIGLTTAHFSMFRACGWGDEDDLATYGYHGDGCIRKNMFEGYLEHNTEWECAKGDRMGCGIIVEDKKLSTRKSGEQPVFIYATKNGKVVHVLGDILPEAGYYPTVSLLEKGNAVVIKYPAEPPLLDIEMENQINLQRDILTDFKMSNRIRFENYEQDGGAKLSLCNHEDDDGELKGVMCIRKDFQERDYFQVTLNECKDFSMGFMEYDADWDDHENCLYSPDRNCVIHREYNIKTKPLSAVIGSKTISALVWKVEKKCAVILFFDGEVLNRKMIGRCVMEVSGNIEIFPVITMSEGSNFDVNWSERESVDFRIDELETWILPSDDLIVDGKRITLQQGTPSLPVCALSTANLSKAGTHYFEVTLEETTQGTFPGVGVCSGSCPTDGLVGYRINGKENIAVYPHKNHVLYGQACKYDRQTADVKSGDVVGCLVLFPLKTDKDQLALVKFYVNHLFVHKELIQLGPSGLYAAICFESEGDSVSVNFEASFPVMEDEARQEMVLSIRDYTPEVVTPTTVRRQKPELILQPSQVFGHSYGTKVGMPQFRNRPMYVYISHTNKDVHKANRLFSELTSHGYLVETSAWNATPTAKRQKIEECDLVLLCFSNSSLKSSEQVLECQHAKELKKRHIPILMQEIKWPPGGNFGSHRKYLTTYEQLKFTFDDDEMNLDNLLNRVYDTISEEDLVVQKLQIQVAEPLPVVIDKKSIPTASAPNDTKKKTSVCCLL